MQPMESMCAHSALQFFGNGAHPFTFGALPAVPLLVEVCEAFNIKINERLTRS